MTIEEKILKTITPHVKTVVSNTSLYTERNVKSVMRKIAWEAFKQGEKEAIGITAKYVLTEEYLGEKFKKFYDTEINETENSSN